MIGTAAGYDPLLKRAFSMFRKTPDGFQLLYRIRGKGTSLLSSMNGGDIMDVLGPLGSPYPSLPAGKIPLIVAGGIGIASVFSLLERNPRLAYMFYGSRSRGDFMMLDELGSLSRELFLSTDDGSLGEQGTVGRAVNAFIERNPLLVSRFVMYGCGPRPMLKELADIGRSHQILTYVSLEEHMACGIGVCLGCAVGVGKRTTKKKLTPLESGVKFTESTYKKVCTDGPVFDAQDVVW